MHVISPEIVDYPMHRTLAEAFGDGSSLATPEPPATALDWLAAICVGVGVGVTLYLVAAFAAGRGA